MTSGPPRRVRRGPLAALFAPSLNRRYVLTAYAFLIPAFAFFGLMFYLPIANIITNSFRTGPQADPFAGFDNYTRAFQDGSVQNSFTITFIFGAGTAIGAIVIGLALALLLNQRLRGRVVFRAALLVPDLTSVAIVGTPDGAGSWQRFWRITLALLAPTTLFVPVMAVISGLQAFGQAYIITGGGPANETDLCIFHLFNVAFTSRDFGYASASSFLLFIVIVIFTVNQLRVGRRNEVHSASS